MHNKSRKDKIEKITVDNSGGHHNGDWIGWIPNKNTPWGYDVETRMELLRLKLNEIIDKLNEI